MSGQKFTICSICFRKLILGKRVIFFPLLLCICMSWLMGSGCGTDGRVVTSDTKGPLFETSQWQSIFICSRMYSNEENDEKEAEIVTTFLHHSLCISSFLYFSVSMRALLHLLKGFKNSKKNFLLFLQRWKSKSVSSVRKPYLFSFCCHCQN